MSLLKELHPSYGYITNDHEPPNIIHIIAIDVRK